MTSRPRPRPRRPRPPAVSARPAPAAADGAGPGGRQEWYVAIGEAQVGPLPLAEVKKRWEAGDIGPDSLVWRPGMGEWGPLSGVPELAAFLAPVPQPSAPSGGAGRRRSSPPPPTRQVAPQARPAAPAPEVEWKPTGASALAALASEELASRAASPVRRRPRRARSWSSCPTRAASIRPAPSRCPSRRWSGPASGRCAAPRWPAAPRSCVTSGPCGPWCWWPCSVVVAAGGGAYAYVQLFARPSPRQPRRWRCSRPPPPPAAAPAPVAAAPAPEPAAANAAAAAPVAAAPPAAAAPAEKVAEAAHGRPKRRRPRPGPPASAGPAAGRGPGRAGARPAAEKPAPKKKDGLLDFDQGGEDDLAAALGSGTGGRKVYVPPAAGGRRRARIGSATPRSSSR